MTWPGQVTGSEKKTVLLLTQISRSFFPHMFARTCTRQLRLSLRAQAKSQVRWSSNKINLTSVVSTFSKGPVVVKYTPEHEWISIHPDGTTFVGITNYAADALGDATFIELPSDLLNEQITKGDTIGSIESVKSASDIYSPVDAEVIEVNSSLEENPGLINEDPMGEGWIAKLKVAEGSTGEDLLSSEEYEKLLEESDE